MIKLPQRVTSPRSNFLQIATSQIFDKNIKGINFVQIKRFLYHWEVLKA